jgi:hypothetical protein
MSTTEAKLTGKQADNAETGDTVEEVLDPSVSKVASTDDLGTNYHLFVAGTDEDAQAAQPDHGTRADARSWLGSAYVRGRRSQLG